MRALRARDHTASSLGERLDRRGFGPEERTAAVERLQELGYVDDERFARNRAQALAERGAGNLLVLADLERHGVAAGTAAVAVAALAPEVERAAAIVARRGASLRTARLLAGKGFDEDVVADVVAALGDEAVG
jgi:regulatory protein